MQHRVRLGGVVAACLLFVGVSTAAAHEELVSSEPLTGASLDAPPAEIVLTFSGELTPESGFVLYGPTDDEVGTGGLDLRVADRNVIRGLGVDAGEGRYTVLWTAVGADGHPLEGTLTFVVGATEQPNTALQRDSPTALTGLALVAVAVATGLTRRTALRAR
jgi:methionine-rich copper-binding protein CopC